VDEGHEDLHRVEQLIQQNLLSPPNNISRLILGGKINNYKVFETRIKVIIMLKDKLAELEFGGCWAPRSEYTDQIIQVPNETLNELYKFPSDLQHAKLQKFNMSMTTGGTIATWVWFQALVKSLKVDIINLCNVFFK
jgi:hypothetical protein